MDLLRGINKGISLKQGFQHLLKNFPFDAN